MSESLVLQEIKGNYAVLTLNRPQQLNALNKDLIEELSLVLDAIAKDDSIRSVVITGSGEKAFVAGADIKEFQHFSGAQGEELAQKGQEKLFDKIAHFPKPVIAAVNGYALGGGLELAMACHMRWASDNAKLGLPEVTLGLIPGYGGTQRLTELVNRGRALEMILTAKPIDAAKAEEIGLVNGVCSLEELLPTVEKIAAKIAGLAPLALSKAIGAVNAAGNRNGYATEIKSFGELFDSEDFKEGVNAFLEKRKAEFKGK